MTSKVSRKSLVLILLFCFVLVAVASALIVTLAGTNARAAGVEIVTTIKVDGQALTGDKVLTTDDIGSSITVEYKFGSKVDNLTSLYLGLEDIKSGDTVVFKLTGFDAKTLIGLGEPNVTSTGENSYKRAVWDGYPTSVPAGTVILEATYELKSVSAADYSFNKFEVCQAAIGNNASDLTSYTPSVAEPTHKIAVRNKGVVVIYDSQGKASTEGDASFSYEYNSRELKTDGNATLQALPSDSASSVNDRKTLLEGTSYNYIRFTYNGLDNGGGTPDVKWYTSQSSSDTVEKAINVGTYYLGISVPASDSYTAVEEVRVAVEITPFNLAYAKENISAAPKPYNGGEKIDWEANDISFTGFTNANATVESVVVTENNEWKVGDVTLKVTIKAAENFKLSESGEHKGTAEISGVTTEITQAYVMADGEFVTSTWIESNIKLNIVYNGKEQGTEESPLSVKNIKNWATFGLGDIVDVEITGFGGDDYKYASDDEVAFSITFTLKDSDNYAWQGEDGKFISNTVDSSIKPLAITIKLENQKANQNELDSSEKPSAVWNVDYKVEVTSDVFDGDDLSFIQQDISEELLKIEITKGAAVSGDETKFYLQLSVSQEDNDLGGQNYDVTTDNNGAILTVGNKKLSVPEIFEVVYDWQQNNNKPTIPEDADYTLESWDLNKRDVGTYDLVLVPKQGFEWDKDSVSAVDPAGSVDEDGKYHGHWKIVPAEITITLPSGVKWEYSENPFTALNGVGTAFSDVKDNLTGFGKVEYTYHNTSNGTGSADLDDTCLWKVVFKKGSATGEAITEFGKEDIGTGYYISGEASPDIKNYIIREFKAAEFEIVPKKIYVTSAADSNNITVTPKGTGSAAIIGSYKPYNKEAQEWTTTGDNPDLVLTTKQKFVYGGETLPIAEIITLTHSDEIKDANGYFTGNAGSWSYQNWQYHSNQKYFLSYSVNTTYYKLVNHDDTDYSGSNEVEVFVYKAANPLTTAKPDVSVKPEENQEAMSVSPTPAFAFGTLQTTVWQLKPNGNENSTEDFNVAFSGKFVGGQWYILALTTEETNNYFAGCDSETFVSPAYSKPFQPSGTVKVPTVYFEADSGRVALVHGNNSMVPSAVYNGTYKLDVTHTNQNAYKELNITRTDGEQIKSGRALIDAGQYKIVIELNQGYSWEDHPYSQKDAALEFYATIEQVDTLTITPADVTVTVGQAIYSYTFNADWVGEDDEALYGISDWNDYIVCSYTQDTTPGTPISFNFIADEPSKSLLGKLYNYEYVTISTTFNFEIKPYENLKVSDSSGGSGFAGYTGVYDNTQHYILNGPLYVFSDFDAGAPASTTLSVAFASGKDVTDPKLISSWTTFGAPVSSSNPTLEIPQSVPTMENPYLQNLQKVKDVTDGEVKYYIRLYDATGWYATQYFTITVKITPAEITISGAALTQEANYDATDHTFDASKVLTQQGVTITAVAAGSTINPSWNVDASAFNVALVDNPQQYKDANKDGYDYKLEFSLKSEGDYAKNYKIVQINSNSVGDEDKIELGAKLIINPAKLVLKVQTKSDTYGKAHDLGTPQQGVDFTFGNATRLYGSDTLPATIKFVVYNSAEMQASNKVELSPTTAAASYWLSLEGYEHKNYEITVTAGTYSISAAAITISGSLAQETYYNGNEQSFDVDALKAAIEIEGDFDVSAKDSIIAAIRNLLQITSSNTSSADANQTAYTVSLGFSLSGEGASNFTLTQVNGSADISHVSANLTIKPAELVITVSYNNSQLAYNGTDRQEDITASVATVAINAGHGTLPSGGDSDLKAAIAIALQLQNATEAKDVDTYTFKLAPSVGGEFSGNYTIVKIGEQEPNDVTTTLEITPYQLSDVTNVKGADRTLSWDEVSASTLAEKGVTFDSASYEIKYMVNGNFVDVNVAGGKVSLIINSAGIGGAFRVSVVVVDKDSDNTSSKNFKDSSAVEANEKAYTVSFKLPDNVQGLLSSIDGAHKPADQYVFEGGKATEPNVADLKIAQVVGGGSAYIFKFWYLSTSEDKLESAVDFSNAIVTNADVELVAHYDKGAASIKVIYHFAAVNSSSTYASYILGGDTSEDVLNGSAFVDGSFTPADVAFGASFGHPTMKLTVGWFEFSGWYLEAGLQNACGDTFTEEYLGNVNDKNELHLYAEYKFMPGLGNVNGDKASQQDGGPAVYSVDAKDVTTYRKWLVGGYTDIEVVDAGKEWEFAQSFSSSKDYFLKSLANINSDGAFDIRDITLIRMAIVDGYGIYVENGEIHFGEKPQSTDTISLQGSNPVLGAANEGEVAMLPVATASASVASSGNASADDVAGKAARRSAAGKASRPAAGLR